MALCSRVLTKSIGLVARSTIERVKAHREFHSRRTHLVLGSEGVIRLGRDRCEVLLGLCKGGLKISRRRSYFVESRHHIS